MWSLLLCVQAKDSSLLFNPFFYIFISAPSRELSSVTNNDTEFISDNGDSIGWFDNIDDIIEKASTAIVDRAKQVKSINNNVNHIKASQQHQQAKG